MELLLKIVGIIALALVTLLLLVAALIWWKWKTIKLAMRSTHGTPAKIGLLEDEDPQWLQKEGVLQALAKLEASGLKRAGAYIIDGMPGVRVFGMTHPTADMRCCIYEHDVMGNWIDLCATLLDGTELTVTNAKAGGELQTRPGTEKAFLPHMGVDELWAEFDRRAQAGGLKPNPEVPFKDAFMADYARDMAWRNSKAGISREEFLRITEREKKSHTPDQLEEAFTEVKLAEMRRWEHECVEQLEKTSTIPVSQWREYEGNMVMFREDFYPKAYVRYLSETIELSEETLKRHEAAATPGVDLKRLFEVIATEAGAQWTRLGEVDAPIRAEVYGVKVPEKV